MKIKPLNPIARAIAYVRRRKQIVKQKKGKGSYERANSKKITRQEKKSWLA